MKETLNLIDALKQKEISSTIIALLQQSAVQLYNCFSRTLGFVTFVDSSYNPSVHSSLTGRVQSALEKKVIDEKSRIVSDFKQQLVLAGVSEPDVNLISSSFQSDMESLKL